MLLFYAKQIFKKQIKMISITTEMSLYFHCSVLWITFGCSIHLKRLSLQLWTFFDFFVKVELNYVFQINLFTVAENCTEKLIIL